MNQKMIIVMSKAIMQKIVDELNSRNDTIAKEREISSSPGSRMIAILLTVDRGRIDGG